MGHILIVEDDLDLRYQLSETLTDLGHTVAMAASGEEAVAWSALGQPLDLVLTDVRMGGMGGLAAFEELGRQRPGLRGIVMTGYASSEAPGRAVLAGAWDYLYKPFDQTDLVTAIDRVLGAEQFEEQTRGRLSGLLESARRWLRRALGRGPQKLRDDAYRAFYTGIRSRMLGRNEALAVWDELERAERLYQAMEADPILEQGYRKVLQLIAGLKNETVVLYWESERAPEQVARPAFDTFFGRIAKGRIPAHLLPMGLSLRTLEPGQLVGNPQLREMAEEVWGSL